MTEPTEPKTRTSDEINALILNWRSDPCYDLEDAEGFEAHREYLRAYRLAFEAKNAAAYKRRLEERAAKMGIPENLQLAEYIIALEGRIAELRDQVDALNAGVAENNRLRVESYSLR